MLDSDRALGEVMVELGLVTEEQLRFAMEEETRSGTSAWRILLGRGVVSEDDLVRARATQIGVEFVDVQSLVPEPAVIESVPYEVAKRQLALPVRRTSTHLVVAVTEPRNHLVVSEIARIAGIKVVPAAAYKPHLDEAIDRAYARAAAGKPAASTPAVRAASAAPASNGRPSVAVAEPPGRTPETTSVSQDPRSEEGMDPNFSEFLDAVIDNEASDLHLTAGRGPMMRVDGGLVQIPGYRMLKPTDIKDLIYSILTQKQREMFEEKLELDVSYSMPGRGRFRVNVFQQRDSVGAVMRLIPFDIRSLDDLGLPPSARSFCELRRGLVLVTGVTGSGKSTTLASMIDVINETRAEHIMTVEDPIEFLHRHKKAVVNQREVAHDTHSFANALKHVLRQDPDVILVGEMRDLETISTALTAAETGHLVFGTLHTQDAPQSVDRVIDVFPPHQQEQIRVQLSGTLAGVVSQQLVPCSDGKGRAVAAEVLVATPAVRNLIREGKTHQIYTSMQAGAQHGMQVMDQHLAELVKFGTVTYEVALERCHHIDEFKRLCGRS